MRSNGSTPPFDMVAHAATVLGFSPATTHALRDLASEALGAAPTVISVNSDEHAQALDRVARARCAEWLDREHGMEITFARDLVNAILDIYTDSTQVRR